MRDKVIGKSNNCTDDEDKDKDDQEGSEKRRNIHHQFPHVIEAYQARELPAWRTKLSWGQRLSGWADQDDPFVPLLYSFRHSFTLSESQIPRPSASAVDRQPQRVLSG